MKTFLSALAVLAVSAASFAPASAQSRLWQNVCGGDHSTFKLCASVSVDIDPSNRVTLRVLNLNGATGFTGAYAGGIFTQIGLDNLPTLVDAVGEDGKVLGMSGFTRLQAGTSTADTPDRWALNNNKTSGGGLKVDMVGGSGTPNNGIASNCADPSTLPDGSNQLWITKSCNPGSTGVSATPWTVGTIDPVTAAPSDGWVTFQFNITPVDRTLSQAELNNAVLYIKAQSGPNDASTNFVCANSEDQCAPTVVPEPMSMVLLGTGLAGVAGAARRRRRKQSESDEAVC